MSATMSGLVPNRIVYGTTWDIESGYSAYIQTGSAPASAVWPAANLAIAVPYRLREPALVRRLWVANGATAAGNVDVGIYWGSNWARLVSAGATAQSGTGGLQYFDVTDTVIPAGLIYIAVLLTDGTATVLRSAATAIACRRHGIWQQAVGSGTLPDPFVPAAVANAYLPLAGFTTRASP